MSEVLRAPWLLQSVLDDLSNETTSQSGLNHLHRTPKLLQIIQFMRSSNDSTHMLAHLSDKFHYAVSFFTDQALGRFVSRNPTWSITDILGAIIRIVEYRFVKVPCSGDSLTDSVILVIEDFEHVGSDGSPAFGDPRYIPCNPAVKLALQRPAPMSPSKLKSQSSGATFDIYTFTQSLDPSDLLFLESTCTQSLRHTLECFPQVIKDSDWRVPVEQARILEALSLPEQPKLDFYSVDSDVDLSDGEIKLKSSPKRRSLSPKRSKPTIVSSFSIPGPSSTTQPPLTQMPLTQQTQILSQSSQSSPSRVVFPISQSSSEGVTSTAITAAHSSPAKGTLIAESSRPPSSPINSPVKSPARPSIQESPLRAAATSASAANILEFPDYSAW